MLKITVNGTALYHEVRGTGPPVLLIMGATGDGGHFDRLADRLADEFTVISYDRRGNGRSPAPAGWRTTSPEEQADDAAALLGALETGPAAIFGTSSGENSRSASSSATPDRCAARSCTSRGCTPCSTTSTPSGPRYAR
jgi:pimeloyl-ACP methyl ester carboxylesterase